MDVFASIDYLLCFNSTTVQLILRVGAFFGCLLQCFNSTTVQLILLFFCHISTHKSVFQFHNGTINTRLLIIRFLQYRRFNSTTVQLIRAIVTKQCIPMLFQFHNGTINTRVPRPRNRKIGSFNSTTVQLILKQAQSDCQRLHVSIPQRYN